MDIAIKMEKEKRNIVVPGEIVGESSKYLAGHGIYKDENYLRAGRLGILNQDEKLIRIIPLNGKYIPKLNDRVIGRIFDVLLSGWRLEINSPYSAVLTLKDATSEFIQRGVNLTQFYDLGDYVITKIVNVTTQKLVDLTMKGPGLRKLNGGRIVSVNPHKVPRIIGKEGSMVQMIKETTGCDIVVGQNGWIWLSGDPEMELIAVNSFKKIEEEAHTSGLTERMKDFLDKQKTKTQKTQKKVTKNV